MEIKLVTPAHAPSLRGPSVARSNAWHVAVARANGLRVDCGAGRKCAKFTLSMLVDDRGRHRRSDHDPAEICALITYPFDHVRCFRRNGRPIAIASHPYRAALRNVDVPPGLTAHETGLCVSALGTTCVLVTRPGVTVLVDGLAVPTVGARSRDDLSAEELQIR